MPDGSSSDAPVISPGPRTPIKRRMGPVSTGLSCFPRSAVMPSVIRSDCMPLRREHNGDLGGTFHCSHGSSVRKPTEKNWLRAAGIVLRRLARSFDAFLKAFLGTFSVTGPLFPTISRRHLHGREQ